jgi:hypothetical protein
MRLLGKVKKVVSYAQRRFAMPSFSTSYYCFEERLRLPKFLKIWDAEKLQMREMLKAESATVSEICGKEILSKEITELLKF